MTIHELLAAAGLTANDEIPIWDAEATGEPTKKVTAQQLAAAVVSLANLVTGVKGNTENSYRTGNVNITPANIGAVATNLTAIADCDDNTLTGNGGQIHFYGTNNNTLNTPYKQGLTNKSEGLLIVLGNAGWTTQIHYQNADTKYYIRSKSGSSSTWNGKAWTASVTGIKGNAESSYRTGDVNLTAANVGAAISGALGSTVNLDDLHTTGLYYADGASATGFPQNNGKVYGGVINISNDNGTRTIQIVAGVFSMGIYYRQYVNDSGGWGAWKQVTLT
jgi:hypothetical protein